MRSVQGALVSLALPACSLVAVIRSQAAQDFSCPENQVQSEETADGWAVKAKGCGRQAIHLRGGAPGRGGRSPIERASFDLSGRATQLEMTYLGNNSIGVDGCGKKATYA